MRGLLIPGSEGLREAGAGGPGLGVALPGQQGLQVGGKVHSGSKEGQAPWLLLSYPLPEAGPGTPDNPGKYHLYLEMKPAGLS